MSIFTHMNEEQKLQGNSGAEQGADNAAATAAATAAAEKAKADRIKRMRGWMGIKSDVETRNIGGNFEPLVDVDAPNGWNR